MASFGGWIAGVALVSTGVLVAVSGCGAPSPTPNVSVPVQSGAPSAEPGKAASKGGTIQCGKATCDASKEACCYDTVASRGSCVPVSAEGQYTCPDPSNEGMRCDDAGDCAAGSVCCEMFASSDSSAQVVCEPKICTTSTREYCTAGSACRPGFKCVIGPGDAWGDCRQEHRSVKCGDVTCADEQPVCCWNGAKKKGTCAKECKLEPDVAHLGCTSSDDCGGYVCANDGRSAMNPQAPPLAMFCMTPYETGNSTHTTCKTVADCPERTMYGGKVTGCADASPDMPPGTKWCIYGED